MKSVFLWIVLSIFVTAQIGFAAPAYPEPFEIEQPDGYRFQAQIIGDEFFHYVIEAHTGSVINLDQESGYWVHAALPGIDETVPFISLQEGSNARFPAPSEAEIKNARRAVWENSDIFRQMLMRERSAPTTGTIKVPVIIINFSDRSTTYTNANFNQLIFGNYPALAPYGSMKDYYYEVSYQQLTLTGSVLGWYVSSYGHDYYGQNDAYGYDLRPRDLVTEAITAADPFVDFSQFDNDGDGFIDMVIVIHQGRGEEESGNSTDIWSHQWSLAHPGVLVDGVRAYQYTLQPEMYASQMTSIGVIAHETGHAFGLPDLYDYSNTTNGIGQWGIMGSGSWNQITNPGDCPAHFCAWSKKELGWSTLDSVNGYNGSKTLTPSVTSKTVLKYTKPSDSLEYFLMENRKRSGFDRGLPGEGMLLLHIDDHMSNNDLGTWLHKRVDVEEADGLNHLDSKTNRGDAGDVFPGTSNTTIFSDSSNPNAKWYDNGNSALQMSLIQKIGDQISMNFAAAVANYTLTVLTTPYNSMDILLAGNPYLSPYTASLPAGSYQVQIPQSNRDESAFVPGTDTRYTFQQWEDASVNNPRSVALSANRSITATMAKQVYIKTETNPAGIGTVSGEGWYNAGTSAQFSAPVIPNYTFSHWEVNGATLGSTLPLSTTASNPMLIRAHYNPTVARNAQIAYLLPKFPASGGAPILVKLLQTTGLQTLQLSLTITQGSYVNYEVFSTNWNILSSSWSSNTLSLSLQSKTSPHTGYGSIMRINLTGASGTYPNYTVTMSGTDSGGNPVPLTEIRRNHFCDLNQDAVVNQTDWLAFSQRYGLKRGDAGWDNISVYSDLDNTDSVGSTIWDLAIFGQHSATSP